ncbi:MAG: hypothetical protein B9S36_04990 [Verrucomicrobiia bacterium Tous-C2TDCM]|nr:MAG: hypothetical protein B9S36_04990 [Verrucomicrobiae bacterium Tous-C2TDCM]
MNLRSGRSYHSPKLSAASPVGGWLPWWCRPSRLLIGASIPALVIFSLSDSSVSLSQAQHFYGIRDFFVALFAIVALIIGALVGESGWLGHLWRRIHPGHRAVREPRFIRDPKLGETLLSERFDYFLMAVFVFSHLVFFRNFFLNPGLVAAVLGGDLELKYTFKTIPGVTTWTQVSLVLGAIRGMRWSGMLPGKVKLLSLFHLVFFGTLFVRAVLWSERLAFIEGFVPFFLCALPRMTAAAGPRGRTFWRWLPLLLPLATLLMFISFEFLRSWQYYSGHHSSLFEFGWRRLYTYYFEAMNTGAAILEVGGFYDGIAGPLSFRAHEAIYDGLYLGTLDVEYNNPGGIHYVASRMGNVLLWPFLTLVGIWFGLTWRAYVDARLFALFYPITFLGLMEILRIPYWFGLHRVVPTSLVIFLILLWAASLKKRVRWRRSELDVSPPEQGLMHSAVAFSATSLQQ